MSASLFRYVALGDSTATGVGAYTGGGYPEHLFQRLKAAQVPVGILNLGQAGATSRDLLQGVVQQVARRRPALVTLGIGANDAWRMVPVEVFASNLQRIADALETSGAEVVCCNIVDLSAAPVAALAEALVGVSPSVLSRRIDALNAHVAQLAQRPRFTVVDLCGFSRGELAQHPEYVSADGFHPSAAGYRRWAELLWPPVEAVARTWQALPQAG